MKDERKADLIDAIFMGETSPDESQMRLLRNRVSRALDIFCQEAQAEQRERDAGKVKALILTDEAIHPFYRSGWAAAIAGAENVIRDETS